MLSNILQNHSHTIASGLNAVGIDYNKVSHQLRYETGNTPIHGNIALNDKSSKDANPYIFVNHFDAGGHRHFSIVAKNHKGGAFIFDSFKESKGDTDYSNYTPIIHTPKPKQPPKEKPLFKRALQAWNESSAANVLTHDYIVKKGVSVEGIELKRGGFAFEYDGFSYRDCIMFRIFDIDGNLRAFQFIDGNPNLKENKHVITQFEGGKSGAFAVIGNADLIATHGAKVCEGLATGLSAYHSNGNGKTTLNNENKTPVIVAIDAKNLTPVFEALAVKYGADKLTLLADNDTKETGNTGRFEAVKICKQFGLKSYLLPVARDSEGETDLSVKLDFNDTLEFAKIKAPKQIDYALDLLQFCSKQQIDKYASNAAFAFAETMPAKNTIDGALNAIRARLMARGYDNTSELLKGLKSKIEWHLSRRRKVLIKNNRAAMIEGVTRHDVTGKTNTDIINSVDFNNRAVCDVRGMAAGKTELMALRIARLSSCAYITHRIGLIDDACARLGLSHYHEGDRYADKIAVCVNSIQKFEVTIEHKPLFIDEARQVLETAIASPTIDNRQPLIDCLIRILNNAPAVHLADADLNTATIEWFKKHCKHLTFDLLETATASHTASHTVINNATGSNFDAAKVQILNELNNGFAGMAGVSSEKQARHLHHFLIKNGIDPARLLLLTGKNKAGDYDDTRQAEFFKDIKGQAGLYDLIIYTSVLGSGVSIVVEKFEFTYLLLSNVLPANENMQLMARNRCAKRVYVAFDKQGNTNRVTDVETLKNAQIEKVRNFAADLGIDATQSLNDLGLMQCELKAVINNDLNDYENNFLLLAGIGGREFEHQNALIDANGWGLKESAKETKETALNNVLNAPHIDEIEYKQLKRTNATTQQQSDAIKRFEAVAMTGAGANALTLDDVQNFNNGYLSKLNNYLLIDADTQALKEKDKENHASRNTQKSLVSRQKIFKAVITPLIEASNAKGITQKDFQQACKTLKKYHLELAGEFANYNKEKFTMAGKTIANFVEKIGFEIAEKKVIHGASIYEIFLNDDIARYATNRAGCS